MMNTLTNMNEIRITNADDPRGVAQVDYSILTGKIRIYFRDLETRLISHIEQADAITGCVAWLTNENIIRALSKKPCSILVQKEDLWRPDIGHSKKEAKNRCKYLYSLFKYNIEKIQIGATQYSIQRSDIVEPVRCVGIYNSERSVASPRMHHKFIVFSRFWKPKESYIPDLLIPYAVWTGSYNFTNNAEFSMENAVYIEDEAIARAFADQHVQTLGFSEPLNWDSDWIESDYRIGS